MLCSQIAQAGFEKRVSTPPPSVEAPRAPVRPAKEMAPRKTKPSPKPATVVPLAEPVQESVRSVRTPAPEHALEVILDCGDCPELIIVPAGSVNWAHPTVRQDVEAMKACRFAGDSRNLWRLDALK
jgi:hypothetical protein